MSSSGAEQITAANNSGCWVSEAPTSRPPLDPPEMASWPGVVQPSATSRPAAAAKSSKTFCLRSRMPGPVPVLALLAAAAQVSDGIHPARLDPGQRLRRVRRAEADVEAAVPVQHRRPGARCPASPAEAGPEMTIIRIVVPSADGKATCSARTCGTSTEPGERAQVVTAPLRASKCRTRGGVT